MKKQQGFGHVGLIIAVVVVVAAAAAAGWWVYSKNSSDSDSQGSVAECDYNDEALCSFFNSGVASTKYTITTNITKDGKEATVATTEVDDNNIHSTTTSEGVTSELINVEGALYTKAADGTWWKSAETSEAADIKGGSSDFEEPSNTNSYEARGTEPCGDLTCYLYKVTYAGQEESSQTYIWFDTEQFLLRRTQITAEDGTLTEVTYTYDEPRVTAPSPAKDLGPNQYIVPGQSEPITTPAGERTY